MPDKEKELMVLYTNIRNINIEVKKNIAGTLMFYNFIWYGGH